MRWSEATTLQFVKLYLKQECLWNPAHQSYKLKFKREKAYSNIITEFRETTGKHLSLTEVKMKIKNLRTTYSQQVQKILQKSNPDSIYEPSLIWFHEMDECLKHVPSNRHFPSYSQDTSEMDINPSIWMDPELLSGSMEGVIADPPIAQQSLSDEEYDNHEGEKTSNSSSEHHSPVKYKSIKKKRKQHPEGEYLIQDKFSLREDEFDIYGKYIAAQLRKMDLNKALKIQLEIQNLISGARMSREH